MKIASTKQLQPQQYNQLDYWNVALNNYCSNKQHILNYTSIITTTEPNINFNNDEGNYWIYYLLRVTTPVEFIEFYNFVRTNRIEQGIQIERNTLTYTRIELVYMKYIFTLYAYMLMDLDFVKRDYLSGQKSTQVLNATNKQTNRTFPFSQKKKSKFQLLIIIISAYPQRVSKGLSDMSIINSYHVNAVRFMHFTSFIIIIIMCWRRHASYSKAKTKKEEVFP